MARHATPLPGAQTHFQHHAVHESGAQARHLDVGHLEVMRIRRVVQAHDGRQAPADGLKLQGQPGSTRSKAVNATLTFIPAGKELPPASYNEATGTIDLYYPEAERERVTHLLRSPHSRFCYFWEAKDHRGSLAWILVRP